MQAICCDRGRASGAITQAPVIGQIDTGDLASERSRKLDSLGSDVPDVHHNFTFITYITSDVLNVHSRHGLRYAFSVSIFRLFSCFPDSTEGRRFLVAYPIHRHGCRPLAHLCCHVFLELLTLRFRPFRPPGPLDASASASSCLNFVDSYSSNLPSRFRHCCPSHT